MDRTMKAVLLAVLAVPSAACGGEADTPLAFHNVRVFNGVGVIARGTVVVQNGIIKAIAETARPPDGAKVIDGKGRTLLPGLIDAHVHIAREGSLSQALVFGVTTELDMFMSHEFGAAIRGGKAGGPAHEKADFRTAGTAATSPGGHGTQYGLKIPTISKAEDAQTFVDARIAEGSDYIKIIYAGGRRAGVSKAVLSALIRAAHKRRKLAVVHIDTLQGAKDVVAAGADGLAHIFSDRQPDDGFVRLAAQRGVFIVATLTVLESVGGGKGGASLAAEQAISPYLSDAAAGGLRQSLPGKLNYAAAEEAIRLLKSAGVAILAGTDSPNPGTAHGASLHRELELLVKAGLKPTEALAGATSSPAKVFGLTDRGRIAKGLRADLLLVKGDPTTDIRATRDIVGVWKQGRRVDRRAHRQKLERARARLAEARKRPPPKGSESGLVSDFEQDARKKPQAKFGFGWMVSTDRIRGGKSSAQMKIVTGGAEDSKQSLSITGEVAGAGAITWAGAMFCPGRWPFAAVNLSSKKAIRFWAKGDGQTYCLMVYAQRRGYVPAVQTFAAKAEWKQFTFGWKDFAGLDGSDVTAVMFGRSVNTGKFRLRIDNVRFLDGNDTTTRPGR